jgi:hypothetical protein
MSSAMVEPSKKLSWMKKMNARIKPLSSTSEESDAKHVRGKKLPKTEVKD